MLRKNAKLEMLKRVPLFATCSKKQLSEIASIADEFDQRQGTVLAKQGDRGREFMVLIEGTARVVRDGKKLASLGRGAFSARWRCSPTNRAWRASSPPAPCARS